MLAVVFGIERFHIYLFGSTFTVITDHKPLLGIIKSNRSCTPRIERWRLRLMPYEFTLMYKPGKNEQNPADYLSRFSFNKPRKNNVGEEYVNYVTKSSVPNALSLDEIKQATKMDKTLIDVMNAIQSNNWRSQNLVSFEKMRHELSIYDGIVLRQNRIVIPETLQRRVVALAHVSHQGIVKTKQLLREKVWFAGIDNLVEQEVKNCLPCQAAYVGTKPREPLSMTPLPSSPWDELSADFMGPFPTGEYLLVVIDDFSRFPEVEIIHSTSSKTTCQKLNQIFSRFGVPSVLKTDNGPPFNGAEFASFARNVGFHHRKITPLWPEANGEAERFVRSLKKFIHTCIAERSQWKEQLPNFLRQYRATPHSSTKVSPHEALTGRKMKTHLPEIKIVQNASQDNGMIYNQDIESKSKQKLYADKRRKTFTHKFEIGDAVLVRQHQQNKLMPPYDPTPFVVENVKGSMITVTRGNKRLVRNSSFLKPVNVETTVQREPLQSGSEDESITMEEEDDITPLTTHLNGDPHAEPSTSRSLPSPVSSPVVERVDSPPQSRPHTVTKSGRVVKLPNKLKL